MIIVPSSKYISHSFHKKYTPGVLLDRFSKTKYELLEKIKDYIKKIEKEESKVNRNNNKYTNHQIVIDTN